MQKANLLRGNLQSQKTLLLVAFLVLIADQLTKLWVTRSLLLGESWPQEGFLRLTHVNNEGIVFGLSVHQAVPIILPLLVIAMVLFLSHRHPLFNRNLVKVPLGLFLGGNVGNLIDRLRLGHVTDFVDFHLWGDFHWPAFNLADTAIVVGMIVFIYSLARWGISPNHDNGNSQKHPSHSG